MVNSGGPTSKHNPNKSTTEAQRKANERQFNRSPRGEHELLMYPSICNYGVYKATISADPILFAEDCIVLVIYEDLLQLAFIRLKDTRWTYVDRRWKLLEDVVRFQDNFYLDNRRTLLSFHLTRRSYTKVSVIAKAKKPKDPCFKTYRVNSNEEKLLMVQRFILDFEDGTRETTKFKVFELDYAKCKWIAMDTLRDAALFLGDNSSICVLASKFSRCQANCIYYNHHADRMSFNVGPYGPHDFGVYNVITGRDFKAVHQRCYGLCKERPETSNMDCANFAVVKRLFCLLYY